MKITVSSCRLLWTCRFQAHASSSLMPSIYCCSSPPHTAPTASLASSQKTLHRMLFWAKWVHCSSYICHSIVTLTSLSRRSLQQDVLPSVSPNMLFCVHFLFLPCVIQAPALLLVQHKTAFVLRRFPFRISTSTSSNLTHGSHVFPQSLTANVWTSFLASKPSPFHVIWNYYANKRLRWSRGSMLAFGTQIHGFKPEVKPSVPYRKFTACKRSLNVTWKSGIFRQNSSPISRPSSSSFHY